MQENLVECKHHKLARSLRSGPTDRDLKPNAITRDQLNVRVVYFKRFTVLMVSRILFMPSPNCPKSILDTDKTVFNIIFVVTVD